MSYPKTFNDGVIYPIPPAFASDDKFDHRAVEDYLAYLHDQGAKTILTTAGTSRFNMLTEIELTLFNHTCMDFKGNTILGLPAVPDKQLERWINRANEWRPDAVLLVYPDRYYGDEAIIGYFQRAADKLNVPVMIHGMFMRHATAGGTYNYTPDLVKTLRAHPNIVGIKEESTSFEMAYKVARCATDDFLVFPAGGSCRRFLLTHPAGAQTFLGGIGNIFPQIEEAFFQTFTGGHLDEAYRIVERYEDPLFKVFGPIGWHRALQVALNVRGLLPTHNRLPFAPATGQHIEQIQAVLDLIEERLHSEGLV